MSAVEAIFGLGIPITCASLLIYTCQATDICNRIFKIIKSHYPHGASWVHCSGRYYLIAVDTSPPVIGGWVRGVEMRLPKWKVRRAFFTGRLRKLIETELAIQMLKGEL